MAIELTGKVEGSVRKHNEATLKAVWDNALLVLPQEQDPEHVIETTPAAAGNECFSDRYPTLIFAHGSSGITPAIREFARFIAQETGWAVVAPDSMQTKDRITYTSPVARSDYEAVHSMRSEELVYCANKLFAEPWFAGTYAVAGTSEGGVTAARFDSQNLQIREKAKLIFSWSCESNYHVEVPRSVLPDDLPVLNVMSLADKYFSPANSYLDNGAAFGYAREALKNNPNASILLLPQAPHTLLNLPQVHAAAAEILQRVAP